MKRGTTPTLEIKLELNATDVTEVYFTFKEKVEDSDEFLLQKKYPKDASYDEENEVFLLPLTQEDTLALTDTYFLEAEVVIGGKSVIKSDIGKEIMQPTLYTEVISGNESNGNNETITLSFTDYIKQEGSGSSDYNDLSHKPKFNGIEWVGNKTDADMGIATKDELQTKADKSDTYTKEETNTFLNAKQDSVSGGEGIKIENDEISVVLITNSGLMFINGQLTINNGELGANNILRQALVNTVYPNPLASKSYVDNLMSGATKWEFVSQLPTENIDIHTIYFVPKESAETDNIYDEWVYAIQSRNPDVYDWELLGTSQVDLSNYYTKAQTDNLLADKQGTLTEGNGVDISNDEISVDLDDIANTTSADGNVLKKTLDGKLVVYTSTIVGDEIFQNTFPYDTTIRQRLTNTNYNNALASKSYVDDVSLGLANSLSLSIDDNTYIVTVQLKHDNTVIDTQTINLYISDIFQALNDVFAGLNDKQDTITSQNKLSADYIDDSTSTNKFVSEREKASIRPITDTAKGSSISLTDSADSPLDAISIMGKSTQNVTPTIDNPIPIVDITAEEIEVTNGTDTQTCELALTLRGIPVASDGNYTDNNNQQWLCDTIERYADGTGKYIQRVNKINPNEIAYAQIVKGSETANNTFSIRWNSLYQPLAYKPSLNVQLSRGSLSNMFTYGGVATSGTNGFVINVSATSTSWTAKVSVNDVATTVEEFTEWLTNNTVEFVYPMEDYIETPLTSEELAELDLSTYYPTTNISSNADVVVKYVCDTKNWVINNFEPKNI